jgi:hypothetical protein
MSSRTGYYQGWSKDFSATVIPTISEDGKGDGVFDAADYSVWCDRPGQTSRSGAASSGLASVPKPLALPWLVTGSLAAPFL